MNTPFPFSSPLSLFIRALLAGRQPCPHHTLTLNSRTNPQLYLLKQVKYSGDTRYNNSGCGDDNVKRGGIRNGNAFVATHDDPHAAQATSASALMPLEAHLDEVDVIGIDEGQFFPDLIEFCDKAACHGKVVVVAALDGTFERKEFGQIGGLLAVSDAVTKLNAVCAICGADAPFTRRDAAETEVKFIGGREAYTPVCRSHHTIPNMSQQQP